MEIYLERYLLVFLTTTAALTNMAFTKVAKSTSSFTKEGKTLEIVYIQFQNGDNIQLQNGDLLITNRPMEWSRVAKS